MRGLALLTLIETSLILFSSCSKQLSKQQNSIGVTNSLTLTSGVTGVSLAQAEVVAQNFLQKKSPGFKISIKNSQTITSQGKPYFHIVNANRGFVILSSDSLYTPILAYDKVGNFAFEQNHLDPGILNWLNKNANELDFVRGNKSKYIDSIGAVNKLLWAAGGSPSSIWVPQNIVAQNPSRKIVESLPPTIVSTYDSGVNVVTTVGPLCQTLWGQDYPFNYFCPVGTYSGGHDAAGCVAVAMAQVMYFWQLPTGYAYSNMPLTWLDAESLPPGGDCERLISDVGAAIGTTYGSSSGANAQLVPGMFTHYGYSSATGTADYSQQALSGDDGGTVYASLMTNEIQTYHRPCIASGFSGYSGVFGILPQPSGDGHCWVCDGSDVEAYSTYQVIVLSNGQREVSEVSSGTFSMLHMNWGWEGIDDEVDEDGNPLTDNGWYNCSTNYTQASSESENFQYFQYVIYQIHP